MVLYAPKLYTTVDMLYKLPGPEINCHCATCIGSLKVVYSGVLPLAYPSVLKIPVTALTLYSVISIQDLYGIVIIFVISLFFDQFMSFKYVKYAFVGIKCAVAILVFKAGFNMFKKMKKKVIPILVMGIVFSLMIVFELFSIKFSSIFFILIGGGIGILVECIREVIAKKKEADASKEEER